MLLVGSLNCVYLLIGSLVIALVSILLRFISFFFFLVTSKKVPVRTCIAKL